MEIIILTQNKFLRYDFDLVKVEDMCHYVEKFWQDIKIIIAFFSWNDPNVTHVKTHIWIPWQGLK